MLTRMSCSPDVPGCSPDVPGCSPKCSPKRIWGTVRNRPKCSLKQHLGNACASSCSPRTFSGTPAPLPFPQGPFQEHLLLFLFPKTLFRSTCSCSFSYPPKHFSGTRVPVHVPQCFLGTGTHVHHILVDMLALIYFC